MSDHRIEVIPVETIIPHPNGDQIEILKIWDYECAVRKGEFKIGDLVCFAEPDVLLNPKRPEFAFLDPKGTKDWVRIKAKKIRGRFSQGLVIRAPEGAKPGDNLWDHFGCKRYEPSAAGSPRWGNVVSGHRETPPEGNFPVMDCENFRKYAGKVLQEGEIVHLTSKLHGASARFLHNGEKFHLSSRRFWKKRDEKNTWASACDQNPWIEKWCEAHPGLTLYGEVFGQVQDLKYGAEQDQIFFAVFDIWNGQRFLDWSEMQEIGEGLTFVPHLFSGPYNKEMVLELSEGMETWPGANHIREGVVVRPDKERWDPCCGRVLLKSVGNNYLQRD